MDGPDYLERLEDENRRLQAECDRLRTAAMFGLRVLEDARENLGSDVGGDDIEDWAIAHGLLKSLTVSEPCGDDCSCEGYGDFPQECLRYSDSARSLIRQRAQEKRDDQ